MLTQVLFQEDEEGLGIAQEIMLGSDTGHNWLRNDRQTNKSKLPVTKLNIAMGPNLIYWQKIWLPTKWHKCLCFGRNCLQRVRTQYSLSVTILAIGANWSIISLFPPKLCGSGHQTQKTDMGMAKFCIKCLNWVRYT